MTATLTDRNSLVTQALVDLLRDHWEEIPCERPDDIYYGDQSKYARYPSIGVESGDQDRELNQTGLQERINFAMYILVVYGPIKGLEERRAEIDEITERCVGILHTDRRLGGLVIHGSVAAVEPGFVVRGGALQTVHRITWNGISNNYISSVS